MRRRASTSPTPTPGGVTSPPGPEASSHRVVALGASNLTRGFLTVVETSRLTWGEPLEVFAALGHGRSYGTRSSILGRTLPGIIDCRMWTDLAGRPPAALTALVTDVGNDILYGAPVEDILGWVSDCMVRLRAMGAQTVLTDLPLASIASLSPGRFLLYRRVLVPSCRLSLADVADRAAAVVEGLAVLAATHGARFFRLKPEWYGFDPIHVRPSLWQSAWREILLGDVAPPPTGGGGRSLRQWLRLYAARPEQRWLFGLEQRRRQPALTVGRGTTVWLY